MLKSSYRSNSSSSNPGGPPATLTSSIRGSRYLRSKSRTTAVMRDWLKTRSSFTRSNWLSRRSRRLRAITSSPTRFMRASSRSRWTRILGRMIGRGSAASSSTVMSSAGGGAGAGALELQKRRGHGVEVLARRGPEVREEVGVLGEEAGQLTGPGLLDGSRRRRCVRGGRGHQGGGVLVPARRDGVQRHFEI